MRARSDPRAGDVRGASRGVPGGLALLAAGLTRDRARPLALAPLAGSTPVPLLLHGPVGTDVALFATWR